MRGSALLAWFGMLAFVPALPAQLRNPASPPGVLVDMVVATVNDSAILLSNLRSITNGAIEGHIRQFGSISAVEQTAIIDRALNDQIDRHRLAQAAKSLGPLPPEQVDQIVQGEMERDRQDRVHDLGSVTELSEQLKRLGRTQSTFENEQRVDKYRDIARELVVGRRLARQANLFVTPRMLRETFDLPQVQGRFVHDSSATIVQVRFQGEGALAKAEAAAALWKEQAIDARQLADRFPGVASPIGELTAKGLSPALAPIKTFALAGPEGAVSNPFPHEGGFLVAKVTTHTPARAGKFEDASVQKELRDMCLQIVYNGMLAEGMKRARERTEVWQLQGSH